MVDVLRLSLAIKIEVLGFCIPCIYIVVVAGDFHLIIIKVLAAERRNEIVCREWTPLDMCSNPASHVLV